MLKHIGTHNNKKVVILYHMVPSEDHMCLVVYSDVLPRMIHDTIMKTVESDMGQQSTDFADALFRTLMADGRNVLEVIHKEGFMKKVPTSQVIMQPTANSKIRLDELNSLLTEMKKGDEAIKRMSELDANSGLTTKRRDQRNVGEPEIKSQPIAPLQAGLNDVLTDEVIASQQLVQATRMRNEAKSMLLEADRLEKEAATISPSVVKATKTKVATKTKTTVVDAPVTEKRKPGRPKATVKNDIA